MTTDTLPALRPVHPGEILREDVLPELGLSKAEVARLLGVSRWTLDELLGERQPVTDAMALRIGKLTSSSPESWLNLQRAYELKLTKQPVAEGI